MSHFTDNLMRQFRFVTEASNFFMSQRKQNLTGQQRVLAALMVEDGVVQSYLAEVLDLRPSSLAELLKKMEKAQDIYREEDQQDKRLKRVFLTSQGQAKAKKNADQVKPDGSEAFFAGLSETEQQEFSSLLEKISLGWPAEFQQQADRFVDPMDRLKAMQSLKENYLNQFADNWQSMTKDELKQLKKEMRNSLKEMPFGDPRRGGFPNHFDRNFHRDFRHDFWHGEGPVPGHPFNKKVDPKNDEDEWQDF